MPKTYQPIGLNMTPSKTELGKFLRARRLKLGLPQTEVAKLSGMHQVSYSKFEIGKVQSPKPKYINGLSQALRVKPLQLQTLIPDKPAKTELGRLMRAWRKQLELTPKEFADSLGVSPFTIRAIESGITHSIPYRLIEPLAKALNVEPSTFTNYVGRQERATDSKFGQLIRNRRKELGLSQIRLAEKMQISKQFLSQIELGQCLLRENDVMIKRLAGVLRLSLSRLQAVRPKPRKRKKREPAIQRIAGSFFCLKGIQPKNPSTSLRVFW